MLLSLVTIKKLLGAMEFLLLKYYTCDKTKKEKGFSIIE